MAAPVCADRCRPWRSHDGHTLVATDWNWPLRLVPKLLTAVTATTALSPPRSAYSRTAAPLRSALSRRHRAGEVGLGRGHQCFSFARLTEPTVVPVS
jgi:hypothetical protein